jgi:hypothetical protein
LQREFEIAKGISRPGSGGKNDRSPISMPPQAYMDIIGPLIDKAREFLENGQQLQAFAFVGNLATQSSHSGDDSAGKRARTRTALRARFIRRHWYWRPISCFAIMEAWSLRPDKLTQADAILDKYGSIGASPYAIDVCSLTLETKRGVWVAQPQIKPKGISKKKRTLGKVEFRYYTEVEGRFMHLLPTKEGDQPPTILH